MLEIDFSPSFKKIQDFAKEFNEQFIEAKDSSSKQKGVGAAEQINDIGQMLRTCHITLMKRLVECLSSQINKNQKLYGPVSYSVMEDDLPHLITNNVCLAKSLGCNKRTIFNQLKRLELAGFISDRIFRGSRSEYKIKLNTAHIQLLLNGNPVLVPTDINRVENPVNNPETTRNNPKKRVNTAQNNGVLQSEGMKKIHDTGETYNLKNNNSKLYGETVDKSTISSIISNFKGNTTNQENLRDSASFERKISVNPGELPDIPEKTTPPVAAHPPEKRKLSPDVETYGQLLMNFMFATIFSRMHYHAPKQTQACRDFLISEMAHLKGRELKEKFKELRLRMMLAWDYVQKDPDTRYIPNSPIKYLDKNNLNGFAGTKLWYEKFKENKRKMASASEKIQGIMARWDWMNYALDIYLKDPNSANYFKTKRIIEAKYPEIATAFEQMVIFQNNKLIA